MLKKKKLSSFFIFLHRLAKAFLEPGVIKLRQSDIKLHRDEVKREFCFAVSQTPLPSCWNPFGYSNLYKKE
jgi:hypothetical protein